MIFSVFEIRLDEGKSWYNPAESTSGKDVCWGKIAFASEILVSSKLRSPQNSWPGSLSVGDCYRANLCSNMWLIMYKNDWRVKTSYPSLISLKRGLWKREEGSRDRSIYKLRLKQIRMIKQASRIGFVRLATSRVGVNNSL